MKPPIDGLTGHDPLGASDGVHLLHSMGDTFAIMRTLEERSPASALIVGAGYIGLEMAEALTARGLSVTQMEQLPEVLPTVDPELGALVHAELQTHGVEVLTSTTVERIRAADPGEPGRLAVEGVTATGSTIARSVDMVARRRRRAPEQPARRGRRRHPYAKGPIAVDRQMRTNLPDVFAAGDCVATHHRLLGETYLPLGTTAHKQGRIAGENAIGGSREFRGSLGTQIVKIFDQAAARTGLRHHELPPPDSTRSPSRPRPTTTSATTPEATASESGSPATARPVTCSVSNCTGTARPNRQTHRHRCDGHLPRDDRRPAQ